jgi:hypothetical protein
MTNTLTFNSSMQSLPQMLSSIAQGSMQLPDFQRGWVWDDEHIRSLLVSISRSFPIGAVMLLETGNPDVRFKPRLLEGVKLNQPVDPGYLILDGQQRLTSLFQALYQNQPVLTRDTRGKKIKRWYYLDIRKAIQANGDPDEAIISLPEDRILRNFRGEVIADYSTRDLECKHELLPLRLLFDMGEMSNWQTSYFQFDHELTHERIARWTHFFNTVVQRFQGYTIPVISLTKDTPKEAVCQVFEKVNTGGVSLTVFELLTATYAADDFNLRDDWNARERRLHQHRVLHGLRSDDVLQTIALLATRERRQDSINAGTAPENAPGISCKRKDLLRLSLDDYETWADKAEHGYMQVARFLYDLKLFDARDLPYRTQMIPLAAMMAVLGDEAEKQGVRGKLARWYWCGVFGELYGGAIETRFAKDLPEVLRWVNDGPEPDTVADANFVPSRLLTLQTRNSAAYKGVSALLLLDGGRDFRSGSTIESALYFDDNIDIHHIFPQAWCTSQGIERRRANSIINKTPLSAKTNRIIGGNAPSVYLERLQHNAGIDTAQMDDIQSSHVINPAALRADDFEAFFRARKQALLDRIEKAMGKAILRDVPGTDEAIESEEQEEEEESVV